MPVGLLTEAATTFDPTAAFEMGTQAMNWIMTTVKAEPILSAVFVLGVLVPAGFGIVSGIKHISRG